MKPATSVRHICSLLLIVFLIVLSPSNPVRAMETREYVGRATKSAPIIIDIIANRPGDFTARVQWIPPAGKDYIFQAFHYYDPNYPYQSWDKSYICTIATYQLVENGDWTCHFANAPAGYYRIYFRPYQSPIENVMITITAETD